MLTIFSIRVVVGGVVNNNFVEDRNRFCIIIIVLTVQHAIVKHKCSQENHGKIQIAHRMYQCNGCKTGHEANYIRGR